MGIQDFDDQICELKRRQPFEPFAVEMNDGRVIEVLLPNLAINLGGALYVTEDFEFVDFNCEDVRALTLLTYQVSQ